MSNASDFIIEKGILKKYVGPGGDVVIPEGVTSIGESAFQNCKNLTSIAIPESITSIGWHAFYGCTNLTSIVIPESVTSIGSGAFDGCTNLTSIVIPESITSIGYGTFYGCKNLTSIVIPESVTSIGSSAFDGCTNLTSIVIPESVSSIGDYAFYGCEKLQKITIPVRLAIYLKYCLEASDNLQIHIADLSVLPVEFRPCAALCFAEDGGSLEDPRFESHSKYLKANAGKIVDMAAKKPALFALLCREKWIKAKDADAYLAAVQQTGNTEAIALLLDYQATKLTSKEKEKVQAKKQQQEDTIFDRAVARMQREDGDIAGLNFVVTGDLKIFKSRNELKQYIEEKGGKLQSSISAKTDFLIANDLESNSEKSRKAAELGVEIITEHQFSDKSGRSFIVQEGKLKGYRGGGDVVIPKSVTSIEWFVFDGCANLTSIVIPEGVTSIGDYAFNDCTKLASIVIPESVTSMGYSTFYGCKNLTIHAPAGSYAETYANKNKIPFVAE